MNFPHVKQVLDSSRKWLIVLVTVTPLWHQRSHLTRQVSNVTFGADDSSSHGLLMKARHKAGQPFLPDWWVTDSMEDMAEATPSQLPLDPQSEGPHGCQ